VGVESAVSRPDPQPVVAAAVVLLAGLSVYLVATNVFPYHSSNHDEAVYLQQAAMLLSGQLELHAGDLAGAFHPWFFVEDGGRLYPKYTPYPAALYAAAMALLGEPRVALAAVAAGNVGLVYLLGSMVADRWVGAVAAAVFAASPLALVTTAVFLPYAPTTFLNLLFAVAYLRGVREESVPAAALAGLAVGLAFFARSYTAVLFALPFVAHACCSVVTSLRARGLWPLPGPVRRQAVTAAAGLAFVGLTLAYNARLTGSPLVFPYEAFAPLDGPGFGYREILGHSVEYTPELAVRANGYALWYFATRWFTAGGFGTALAAVGVGVAARRWFGSGNGRNDAGRRAGLLLAGLFVTVTIGNVPFWGNFNVLATMTDPTDGLLSQFGPFYHFDLLVPLSVFAALALVAGIRRANAVATSQSRVPGRAARAFVAIALLGVLLGGGVANAAAVAEPLERNAAYTDKYDRAYEPVAEFETDRSADALVFLPTPYGDWQNHPFQYLRNDPGFDGPVVYALDRHPEEDFALLDAYPDREYYRYTYRGEWTPNPDRHVIPKLEPLEVRSGTRVDGSTTVGVPDRVGHARVRLETEGGGHADYTVMDPGDEVTVGWSLAGGSARLDAADEPVAVDRTDTLVVTVTLVGPDGATLTYRQEATVRTGDGRVEVVWPPERSVCPLVRDCGTEGTYLPEEPGIHRDGVDFDVRVATEG